MNLLIYVISESYPTIDKRSLRSEVMQVFVRPQQCKQSTYDTSLLEWVSDFMIELVKCFKGMFLDSNSDLTLPSQVVMWICREMIQIVQILSYHTHQAYSNMFMSFRLFARYILGSGFACDFLLPQNLRKVAKLTHGYSNGGPIHQNNASNEEAFPTRTYSNKLLYHHSCMSTRPGCILQCVYTCICIYIYIGHCLRARREERECVFFFLDVAVQKQVLVWIFLCFACERHKLHLFHIFSHRYKYIFIDIIDIYYDYYIYTLYNTSFKSILCLHLSHLLFVQIYLVGTMAGGAETQPFPGGKNSHV